MLLAADKDIKDLCLMAEKICSEIFGTALVYPYDKVFGEKALDYVIANATAEEFRIFYGTLVDIERQYSEDEHMEGFKGNDVRQELCEKEAEKYSKACEYLISGWHKRKGPLSVKGEFSDLDEMLTETPKIENKKAKRDKGILVIDSQT